MYVEDILATVSRRVKALSAELGRSVGSKEQQREDYFGKGRVISCSQLSQYS
jgi:hypothetical protein